MGQLKNLFVWNMGQQKIYKFYDDLCVKKILENGFDERDRCKTSSEGLKKGTAFMLRPKNYK